MVWLEGPPACTAPLSAWITYHTRAQQSERLSSTHQKDKKSKTKTKSPSQKLLARSHQKSVGPHARPCLERRGGVPHKVIEGGDHGVHPARHRAGGQVGEARQVPFSSQYISAQILLILKKHLRMYGKSQSDLDVLESQDKYFWNYPRMCGKFQSFHGVCRRRRPPAKPRHG